MCSLDSLQFITVCNRRSLTRKSSLVIEVQYTYALLFTSTSIQLEAPLLEISYSDRLAWLNRESISGLIVYLVFGEKLNDPAEMTLRKNRASSNALCISLHTQKHFK